MAQRVGGTSPTNPKRVAVRLRRTRAVEMVLAGVPRPQVAAELGYKTTSALSQDIGRHLAETAAVPTAELRALELGRLDQSLQRLDEARQVVLRVLVREHVTVSQGRVIYLPDPETGEEKALVDDGPILAAVDRLIAIEAQRIRVQERRARLVGLDAPSRAQVQVITDDDIDRALEELINEERARAAAESAAEAADDPAGEAATTEGAASAED